MTDDEITRYHTEIENEGNCTTFKIEITATGQTRKDLFRGFMENNVIERLTKEMKK